MSTRLERLFSRTPGQRRWTFGAVLAGLIVVPLAVAGVFAGALATADQRLDTLPAIVVNNDTFVTTTAADGTKQTVLAGRLLVTELTAPASSRTASTGFAWTISNSADAAAALASGKAYAVLTIPADFSKSITSIGTAAPTQAELAIRTDDAHSYLAGTVAGTVGSAMTGVFGRQITTQYLSGLYSGLSTLGGSLTTAADGAGQVSTGVTGVATGLDSLSGGAASAATGAASASTGASSFATGVTAYTNGVDALSAGLGKLNTGTAGLSALSSGVAQYTGGVTQAATGFTKVSAGFTTLAGQFAGVAAAIKADPANADAYIAQYQAGLDTYQAGLTQFQGGLDTLSTQGAGLSQQTTSALTGVQGGVAQSATGAAKLAAGSASLRTGATGLASGVSSLSSGVSQLATGTAAAATGVHQLETGASQLATGLASGAESAKKLNQDDPAQSASVVSEPVAITTSRDNPIATIGPLLGMVFVPVGLWIGALAIFLVMRPVTSTALASTASTGRLVSRGFGRAFGLAAAQAVVVVALLHASLGVTWTLLPATLGFAVFLAFVFVAVHQFLTVAFGRVGIVVSLVLLALQLTAVGGLYPIELVSAPFQAISPFLPLTWAVSGMQGIVSGGGAGALNAVGILLLFAVVSIGLTFWAVAAKRGPRSFALALARG
ncbi:MULTISPECIES: YhgE/Pip family protein [Cryobacterium]|uniref:YhgE/Pip domain-containing protein n=1 Tax=Cryobacterium glucosi TaxID=1259175 RepID=A0ABY2IUH2_9MICO|nr:MULTISPECIES: YhgE/Pip family protein [Cryobacterium]TFB96330.1 YhgE/Pip domain-containing protein [Cryobacterium sp. MDB2-A-1]TFC12614.1 YhgE/Pip domain-containing protein [Cryobacterium sp. MDB2-A-2]TFC17008.1 YhgE/Pip domain-containing protein [Cryobacterium sp. MDB2-10]TFC23556.1 YhgE/Pip domain-containing protein [Cryobacterium glucosi]